MVAHAYRKQEFKASLGYYKALCKMQTREEERGVREKESKQEDKGRGSRLKESRLVVHTLLSHNRQVCVS